MSNWIPNIESVEFANAIANVRVLWLNDKEGQKVTRDYRTSSLDNLKSQLRSTRVELEGSTPLIKELQPGVIDIEVTPVPPPEPTEVEIFINNWSKLQSALRKVNAGIIAKDAKEVTELLNLVISLYKPEYVGIA